MRRVQTRRLVGVRVRSHSIRIRMLFLSILYIQSMRVCVCTGWQLAAAPALRLQMGGHESMGLLPLRP